MDENTQTPSSFSERSWFPVDNAANLYAANRRNHWCRTFRVSVILKEDVEPDLMQQALSEIIERFPSLRAMLRNGLFWSYFERTDAVPVLQKETDPPYRSIPIYGTNQPNFRMLYYGRRLSMETYHALSDAGGSMIFLSSLLTRYYELKGEPVERDQTALYADENPTEEETTDPYLLHADPAVRSRRPERYKPYFIDQVVRKNYARVFSGTCRVDDIKAAAAKYEVTVTEYLTALLMYCFIKTAPRPITQDIIVNIPIDLRRRLGTQSLRNFVYMTDLGYFPDGRTDISFEEIASAINGVLLEKTNPQLLLDEISANVSAQTSKLLRPVPYPIKRAFLKQTYRSSQRSFTMFLSNLGVFEAPAQVLSHIERAEFVHGDTPYQAFGCAALSVNGRMTITFCNSNEWNDFQKEFFRFLSADGVALRVETNLEA